MEGGILTDLLITYKYALMAPAALFLGPPVSLIAGILLRLDILSMIPTCLALATGELAGDVLWYWFGRRYGEAFTRRFGRFFGISAHTVATIKDLYARHHDVILFTSKLTTGLGFAIPVLFTAGLARVPFTRYMMLNVSGQFLWTAGLLSIGYFFGHIFLRVSDLFEKMALFALAILIIASLIGFGRYLRSVFLQHAGVPPHNHP